jgi:ArsR family transcriptional regulator
MAGTDDTCEGGRLRSLLAPAFFRALGDPCRIAILAALAERGAEMRVTEVAECCPVVLSVVSRHLRQLRDAGILASHKRGKEVFYRVRSRELAALLRSLADAVESCCPDAEQGERRSR